MRKRKHQLKIQKDYLEKLNNKQKNKFLDDLRQKNNLNKDNSDVNPN